MRISKDPEERKQEIIEAAMMLFEEKGVQKTSMSDIARKLNVAKGLIYYYFRSKDELITYVIESFSLVVDEEIRRIMKDETLEFYGKLGAILNLFFSSIKDHPTLMKITPGNPGMFEYIKTKLSEIAIKHASALIEDGKRQGYVKNRYPEYMLKILISGIADLYVEGVTDPNIHRVLIEEALGIPEGKIILRE